MQNKCKPDNRGGRQCRAAVAKSKATTQTTKRQHHRCEQLQAKDKAIFECGAPFDSDRTRRASTIDHNAKKKQHKVESFFKACKPKGNSYTKDFSGLQHAAEVFEKAMHALRSRKDKGKIAPARQKA